MVWNTLVLLMSNACVLAMIKLFNISRHRSISSVIRIIGQSRINHFLIGFLSFVPVSSRSCHASLRLWVIILRNLGPLRWARLRYFLVGILVSDSLFLVLWERSLHMEHIEIVLLIDIILCSIAEILPLFLRFHLVHIVHCLLINLKLIICQNVRVKEFF
jgi:hypothetical protein